MSALSRIFMGFSLVLMVDGWVLVLGGTLSGHVRDPNWYAQVPGNPAGVGQYEYGVNANAVGEAGPAGWGGTDVFGGFTMPDLPAGTYTVASWDVWWRSAFAFNVAVPASGATPDVDLRLHATLWGYPAFWDDTAHHEFGQTFVASGPVTMLYLRNPLRPSPTFTVTVHAGGPGGGQVGVARSFNAYWDVRLIYGYGEMPTVAGQTYYLRCRTDAPGNRGILCQVDPRPDYSDPMPGGCLHVGDGTTLTAHSDRDLGVVIMSDDDGLITNLHTRQSGGTLDNCLSVGQGFVARGVGLISAAVWLADPGDPIYEVQVRRGGPTGASVGPRKRGRPARRSADPEMLVTWAPGECPLTPGETYYLEVTREGGGGFHAVYVHTGNPFPYGQAYRNDAPLPGTDLAGTLMEEESAGSAARPAVRIAAGPEVTGRGADWLTFRWNSSVAADTLVEYGAGSAAYAQTNYSATHTFFHTVTLRGLRSHTPYHFRVSSRRPGYRPAVSRDHVICTLPEEANRLSNPGFEAGTGSGPARAVAGWTVVGNLDVQAADGSWFGGLAPRSGDWLLEGAVNAGSSDGYAWQRVTGSVPGREYTFSAWVRTDHRENGTWKYDVWDRVDRLIHVRLGIDPAGGTDPNAGTVRWTPRFYSHRRYVNVAQTAVAQGEALTVFVRMQGRGGDWHLYGVDDCVLTERSLRVTEAFEAMPVWSSVHETVPGGGAGWTVAPGGESGHALHLTNAAPGAVARVLTLPVEPETHYVISIFGRCPGADVPYRAECAFRVGIHSAAEFDVDPAAWSRLQLFSRPGIDGTGDVWVRSSRHLFTGAATDVSVAFGLECGSGAPPPVWWDTLRVEPETPMAVTLVAMDEQALWRYHEGGVDLGTAWRAPGYDDGSWLAGPALLADETAGLPAPIRTPLSVGPAKTTFYFRHHFSFSAPWQPAALRLRHIIDDGAVFYLNGEELLRTGIGPGTVGFGEFASRTVGDAVLEGPYGVSAANLRAGENVLTAELHQASADSTDVVFGAGLEGVVYPHQVPSTNAVLRVVRQQDVLVLAWDAEPMQLEEAPDVTGPWVPAAAQETPAILAASNAAAFFRLRAVWR